MYIQWRYGLPPKHMDGGCHLMICYSCLSDDGLTFGSFIYHAAYCKWQPVLDILGEVFPRKSVEYELDEQNNINVRKVYQ